LPPDPDDALAVPLPPLLLLESLLQPVNANSTTIDSKQ
jgi:hypothetical protein